MVGIQSGFQNLVGSGSGANIMIRRIRFFFEGLIRLMGSDSDPILEKLSDPDPDFFEGQIRS